MNADREQILAFAALFQALDCVQRLAEEGRCDSDASAVVIDAIFAIDSPSAESLYPPSRLRNGLTRTILQLDRNPVDPVMRMAITVLRLERRLMTNSALRAALRERIETTERARAAFGSGHENVLAGLSSAYLQTVSPLEPHVMVQGSPLHLQHERTVQHIRALLLGAIRAAVMWRHVGGSGWRLFWRRARWLRLAQELVAQP